MPLRTSTGMPPWMTRPSTPSKLSSSARPSATSGKYHPGGGGGRRSLRRASRAPQALQDQADGADRGRVGDAAGEQFAVDGGRPELAEVTGVVQLLADGQHEVLQVTLGAVNRD